MGGEFSKNVDVPSCRRLLKIWPIMTTQNILSLFLHWLSLTEYLLYYWQNSEYLFYYWQNFWERVGLLSKPREFEGRRMSELNTVVAAPLPWLWRWHGDAIHAEQALLINHGIFTSSHPIKGRPISGVGNYTAELTCHLPRQEVRPSTWNARAQNTQPGSEAIVYFPQKQHNGSRGSRHVSFDIKPYGGWRGARHLSQVPLVMG